MWLRPQRKKNAIEYIDTQLKITFEIRIFLPKNPRCKESNSFNKKINYGKQEDFFLAKWFLLVIFL